MISGSRTTGKSNNGLPDPADSSADSFLKRYKVMEKIGEGSYSEVVKCKNRETGEIIACKRLKHVYKNWGQVNDIAEITTLRTLAGHPNILQMIEIHYDQSLGKVSLVFEIMEMNLYELVKDRKRLVPERRVRFMMYQLMRALRHLHRHGIFHRDIKPENILIRPKTDILKLGDLGSVRGLYSRPPYTEYISTRWYRSPECLLTAGYYSFKMDIWAAGCVFYEILTLRPLFPGSSELDQINRIHGIMGTPAQKVLHKFSKQAELEKNNYRNRSQRSRWDMIQTVLGDQNSKYEFSEGKSKNFNWYFTGRDSGGLERVLPPHCSVEARDLITLMLCYDPDNRPTAHRVIQHEYFNDCRETIKAEKEAASKRPMVEIFGDDKGKEMIAETYKFVDLKTLGDKKHAKRRRETQYTNVLRKAEKVAPKKSSPILKGGGSPETPSSSIYKTTKKPTAPKIPMKAFGVESLKQKENEKQKEVLQRTQVKVVEERSQVKAVEKYKQTIKDATDEEDENESMVSTSPEKPSVKFVATHPTPDTLAAKKRQVLAGNLPPSIFKSMEQTTKSIKIPAAVDSAESITSISHKVINHKLTSDDLKKINETRNLVQMEPIGKSESRKKSIHSLVKESPYIKPPSELSLAGKKKVLMQHMKNSSPNAYQKRLERLKVDSSTMHVPPQVAAAALKYSSQTSAALKYSSQQTSAAAARHPREPTETKRSVLAEKQPNNTKDYSISKTHLSATELAEHQVEISAQQKFKSLIDRLEKKGHKSTSEKPIHNSTEVAKRKPINDSKSTKSKDTPTTIVDRSATNNMTSSIYQTLDLDKQNRLSVRRKEELKNSNDPIKSHISSFAKYGIVDKSKDSQNNEKTVPKQKPTGAGNLMFPRNRFGASGAVADSTRKPAVSNTTSEKYHQIAKVYPVHHDINMNALDGKGEDPEERASKLRLAKQSRIKEEYQTSRSKNSNESVVSNVVTRLGLNLPAEEEFKKPPLPPSKYRRQIDDFNEVHRSDEPTLPSYRSVRVSNPLVESSTRNTLRESNEQQQQQQQKNYYQQSSRKESLTVIETTEAMKRRAERIRAQLREDVYCSSDDDIVSTLRQKFDDLISERARLISDSSSDCKILEDEDGNYTFRSRSERPRKYPRKDLVENDPGISISSWVENRRSTEVKHHVVGDSHKTSDYGDPARYRNGESNRRERLQRHYLEESTTNNGLSNRQHGPLSPNKLNASRGYQRHQYSPQGNKPEYHFVRPQGTMLDRKIGHSHNAPIPISNRSTAAKIIEEQKPARRRHHHLS